MLGNFCQPHNWGRGGRKMKEGMDFFFLFEKKKKKIKIKKKKKKK